MAARDEFYPELSLARVPDDVMRDMVEFGTQSLRASPISTTVNNSVKGLCTIDFLTAGPLPIDDVCDIVSAYSAEFQGQCKWTIKISEHVSALAELPGGKLMMCTPDGTVSTWDSVSGALLCTQPYKLNATVLVVLPDGRVVSGADDPKVRMWDDGVCSRFLSGHCLKVWALAILPGDHLASCSSDNTVRVWDLQSGRCLFTLEGHTKSVWALALLPDGKLASGSVDRTVRVWDTDSGAHVLTLAGHTGSVGALAVLPNGKLASGSGHAVHVWDVTSGACILVLKHADLTSHLVTSLVVLSDGMLASGSFSLVRVWDTENGECLFTIREVGSLNLRLMALSSGELAVSHGRSVSLYA